LAEVQRLPEMSARKEITMAENSAPSLADILIAIPKLSDPDLKKLREAVLIQEALNRASAILDSPDFHLKRKQIEEHLDMIIEHARDSDERGEAVEFKVLALKHVDSVGRARNPAVVEANRVEALKAIQQFQCAIYHAPRIYRDASGGRPASC
jgi:hypothetical protein